MGSKSFGTSFEATHWRTLDPCGVLGVMATLSVHLFAYFTVAINLIEGSMFSTALFLLVYTPVAILAISSLYMAWSTDPGAVPLGARPLVTVKRASSAQNGDNSTRNSQQRALRRCHKCNDNFKPNRAHHDSVTGRCIGETLLMLIALFYLNCRILQFIHNQLKLRFSSCLEKRSQI